MARRRTMQLRSYLGFIHLGFDSLASCPCVRLHEGSADWVRKHGIVACIIGLASPHGGSPQVTRT